MNSGQLDIQGTGYKTTSTQSIMLRVLGALVPGIILYCVFISPLIIFNILFAVVSAIVLEALAVKLKRGAVMVTVSDGSIALAATLLAIAVPPTLPFWQLFIGVLIMVMLGKHVYGGLGNNLFNPAMVGYAALIVSFPQTMTQWLNPATAGQYELVELVLAKLTMASATSETAIAWDAITQATPLEHARTFRLQSIDVSVNEISERFLDSGWLWVNAGFLLGGLYLLYARLIRWHIPVSVVLSLSACHVLLANGSVALHYSVLSGAVMIGAFFIATDPVTTATSNRGRVIFGLGVGLLTFTIREYGGYPEGFAFAILLMNMCVPLIDHVDLLWQTKRQ